MKSSARRTFKRWFLAGVVMTIVNSTGWAQVMRSFDIPAQDLATALETFATQADKEILFDREQARGKRSMTIKGELDPAAALRTLVGASLPIRQVNERTFIVGNSRAESPAPQGRTDDSKVDEVVVTGSHLRGVESASPVVVINRAQIEASGYSTVDQLTQSLSQSFGGGAQRGTFLGDLGSDSTNNLSKGASANLRGLGAGATLTLLNGHRLPAASPAAFVDLSMIPLSAVERVEVVTDGASAIYGSDAIAGVVNIILRNDFDGQEIGARYGTTTQAGFAERTADVSLGGGGPKGHAMLSYEFRNQGGLDSSDRSFSASVPDPTQLFGGERAQSVFATGSRQLGPTEQILGQAYYSNRQAGLLSTPFGTPLTSAGKSYQFGFNGGPRLDLPRGWIAQLDLGYGLNDIQTVDRNLTSGNSNLLTSKDTLASAEARVDGSVWKLAGGEVRLAAGINFRRESHESLSADEPALDADAHRDVTGVYAEGFVPLVGEGNAQVWAQRLELNLAGRYERYSDFGSTVNPKVGLLWAPIGALTVRTTYSTSYRAPTFDESATGYEGDYLIDLPDPAAASGISRVLYRAYGSNPNLRPEKAQNWTTGLDLHPANWPGFAAHATYFMVNYRDRIGRPITDTLDALVNASQYPSVVDRNPDPALVQELISRPFTGSSGFLSFVGPFDPASIAVVIDDRNQNLARTKVTGADLSLSYDGHWPLGTWHGGVNGTYLFHSYQRFGADARVFDAVGTLENPTHLRLRADAGITLGPFAFATALNYVDSYINQQTIPETPIASWTTVDVQAAYQPANQSGALHGLRVALSVQNLFDRGPPYVESPVDFEVPIGYDPTNANPIGRFLSLDVTKRF
jgi:outer membrane receptor protein involved in Fe transport